MKRVGRDRQASDADARCYVCGRMFEKSSMQHCGNGVYRCLCHKVSTILKRGFEKQVTKR